MPVAGSAVKRLKVSRCRCFRRWRNAVVKHDMMANIEIKPTTDTGAALTGKMVALARAIYGGMTAPLLSSFEIDALEAAQQAAPELPRGLLLDEWRDDWRELTARLGCVSIHLNHISCWMRRVMRA